MQATKLYNIIFLATLKPIKIPIKIVYKSHITNINMFTFIKKLIKPRSNISIMTDIINKAIAGNKKRIESCKKVGANKKIVGHKREKDFLAKYNETELSKPTEYGATSDTSICPSHSICEKLKETIKNTNLNVSNKSGKNIQLVLGNIPELKDIDIAILEDKEYVRKIFEKYLKKSESEKPAGLLVYKDTSRKKWTFFNTDDIIDYIVDKCIWRKLETGRIKGDFTDDSKKGMRNYITYEYRNTHKSYFLGFNGDAGKKFIELLKSPNHGINYYEDDY